MAKNGDTTPADKVITGFQDFNVLLPIPLSEIQLNKDAELRQNPGY
ncbi:MAG: RagB/SusD family nutrient uptake outer membrane protein [Candidatus Symbiothrix sp.]|nr:RagB/SusD family nutrient uptake outer membrane protein [Candidatus Symbiothrix sp.]